MTTDELRVKILRDITAFQPAQAEVPTHVKDNLLLLLDMVEGGGGAAGGIGTNAPPHYVIMTYDHAEKLIKTAMSIRDLNAWVYQYFAPRNTMREYDITFRDNMGVILHAGVAPIIRHIVLEEARGRFYILGVFDSYNGVPWPACVMAFHLDGIPDAAYNANIGAQLVIKPSDKLNSGAIQGIVQSDGKLVVIGYRDMAAGIGGPGYKSMVRLNIDGTVDEEFMATIGTGFDAGAKAIVVLEDDAMVISCFGTTFNGVAVPLMVKLNADGTVDTDYLAAMGSGPNGVPYALAVQADGKVLIGGIFNDFDGISTARLARINVDGTFDPSFITGMTGLVESLAVQADQKILVGGAFGGTYQGTPTYGIIRINPDATIDTPFNANRALKPMGAGSVFSIAVQPNGKILLATTCNNWDTVVNHWSALHRLNPDGTPDNATFNPPNTGFDLGGGGSSTLTVKLYTVAVQPDGRILVGGEFAGYDGDPAPNGLFRLLENLPTDGVVPPVI